MPNRPSSAYDRMPRRAIIGLGMMASAAVMLAIISVPPDQQQIAILSAGGIAIAAGLWRYRHRFRQTTAPPVHHAEAPPPPSPPAGFDPAAFMRAATANAGPASAPRTLPALTDERLPKLLALQEHPATPEQERSAAEDTIARLTKTKRRKPRRAS